MSVIETFVQTRKQTVSITAPLSLEDHCVQSREEVSPPKWHLGHTTWFFEKLLLSRIGNYKTFSSDFHRVFNSYYKSLGHHWLQAERGQLSRPLLNEVMQFRDYVDSAVLKNFSRGLSEEEKSILVLGCHHEQQHQELLYMDIKNILFNQYTLAGYLPSLRAGLSTRIKTSYVAFAPHLVEIGHDGLGFAYDNEGPKHRYYIRPFRLRNTLVTNGEYLQFMQSGGYDHSEFWYSDAWDWLLSEKIKNPMYWIQRDGQWFEYDLRGLQPLDLDEPVRHISFYEAAAFARFSGKRLPTEFEWEYADKQRHPDLKQMHYVLWQWTSSPYVAYPGHSWKPGPLGEYNSKFMVNQIVLRGSSLWTPQGHSRSTYRNFFSPDKRWAFTGIRLAEDIDEN